MPAPVALDPVILDLIQQVSEDSLRSYVQTLQDFQTRHTNSDTLSTTSGIGAARRWVHDRFDANAGMDGGYYAWFTEACGDPREKRNVLGTMNGSLFPDRLFMVGAHLDSRNVDVCDSIGFAPGANDDGSGIAGLVELGRLLPGLGVESTVILQAFSGEEQSLLGSEAYAQQAASEGRDIVAMLANDIIGNIDGCPGVPNCNGGLPTDQDSTHMRVFSGDPQTSSSRQLARYVKMVGEGYVSSMGVTMVAAIDRPNRGSDHISFYDAGFAAVRCMESLEYTLQQHNTDDLIGNMEFGYLRRNVMIDLAVIANLALAPPTPTGLSVFDLGTGGGIRVEWDPLAGDVAGYRVAYRFSSGLYYTDVVDAGGATSLDITGLTDELALAVSVSAYDADGHESLFSPEISVTPGVTPHLLKSFAVSSQSDRLTLDWKPPQELDLDFIRILRSTDPDAGFVAYDSISPAQNVYDDFAVTPGQAYYYRAQSVDLGGLESPLTIADKGLLGTYQHGILVVDATKDGFGTPGFPTDALVDDYYAALLANAPVLDTWDLKENLDLGVLLTDAEMAQYQTVWIHSDVRLGQLEADTLEIRQYLDHGGQVFLGAWGLQETIRNTTVELGEYRPGHFFYDVLHVDKIRTTPLAEADCRGARSLVPEFGDLVIDSGKWPFQDGNFIFMDTFVNGPLPGAEPIYVYDSSFVPPGPSDGIPLGLRIADPDTRLIFLDASLYFMQQSTAQACVNQALIEFGYGTASVPIDPAESRLLLYAAPNPFSGTTAVSFALTRNAPVKLAIYDVEGRLVRTLADGKLAAGTHRFDWDGRNDAGNLVGSSVYYGTLQAGDRWASRRILVLR
ncbi:MAG: M28 family peptidase [Candidatus Eisenbacteria bacterium]